VTPFLLVALGGALGSVARYGVYRAVPATWGGAAGYAAASTGLSIAALFAGLVAGRILA
jgi:fluoride ion exporter CrcB/FEX